MYWTPQKIKELKEKGLKLKYYVYDPRFKDLTIEEIEELKQKEINKRESSSDKEF